MKLYPPYIEGKLPAFTTKSDGSIEINVPFEWHPLVSIGEVDKLKIVIKTMSGREVYNGYSTNSKATFNISEEQAKNISVNNFYKIQIAFVNKSEEAGYLSSVGIARCIYPINVTIKDLKIEEVNNNIGIYTGNFESKTLDEKIYSYRFDVFTENNELFATSGDLIHNCNTNNPDTWELDKTLQEDKEYKIRYTITTQNFYTKSSEDYEIKNNFIDDDNLKNVFLLTQYNPEENCVLVDLYDLEKVLEQDQNFRLIRSSKKDGYKDWIEIHRFYGAK